MSRELGELGNSREAFESAQHALMANYSDLKLGLPALQSALGLCSESLLPVWPAGMFQNLCLQ